MRVRGHSNLRRHTERVEEDHRIHVLHLTSSIPPSVAIGVLGSTVVAKISTQSMNISVIHLSDVISPYLKGSPHAEDTVVRFLWAQALQCQLDNRCLLRDQIVGSELTVSSAHPARY